MQNRSQPRIFLGHNLDRWMHPLFKPLCKYEKWLGSNMFTIRNWFDVVDPPSDQHQPLIMIPFLRLQRAPCFLLSPIPLLHRPCRCFRHSSPKLIPKAGCYLLCALDSLCEYYAAFSTLLDGDEGRKYHLCPKFNRVLTTGSTRDAILPVR